MAPAEIDSLTAGRRVLVVDEVAARARGHQEYKELFPRAVVHHLVLAILSPALEEGRLEDLGTEYCAALSPLRYRQLSATLLELTGEAPPLDPDHLNLVMDLVEGDWERLQSAFYRLGLPYDHTSYLGSDALQVWTLDDPSFFRLPTTQVQMRFDGPCKIRLYFSPAAKRLTLVPIAYPQATFTKSEILSFLGDLNWPIRPSLCLPPHLDDLTSDGRARAAYVVLTTAVSAQLLLEFLSQLGGILDSGQLAERISLSPSELFPEMHSQCATHLLKALGQVVLDTVRNPAHLPGLEPWRAWPIVSYIRPRPQDQTASVFSMSKVSRLAVDSLRSRIDLLCSADTSNSNLRVPARTVLADLVSRDSSIRFSDLSRWLDYALDNTVAKPGELVLGQIEESQYRVERGYALGENSGFKLDRFRPQGERFVRSARQALGDDDVDRCLAALYIVLARLCESANLQDCDEYLLNKVLANLLADWPAEFRPLDFKIRPYRYGPVVDVPQRQSRLNEFLGLRATARSNPHYFTLSHNHERIAPKPLRPSQREHLEEFITQGEEQSLVVLTDLYVKIVKELDQGRFNKPDILLQASIVADPALACEFFQVELSIWISDIRDLLNTLRSIEPGTIKGREDYGDVPTKYANLHIAPNEIDKKQQLLRQLARTGRRLDQLVAKAPNERQLRAFAKRYARAESARDGLHAEIRPIVDLAPVLRDLNALVGAVCRAYGRQNVDLASSNDLAGRLADRFPTLGVPCEHLITALTGGAPDACLDALDKLVAEVDRRVLAPLAPRTTSRSLHALETTYHHVNRALEEHASQTDRLCLIGYMELLGVVDFATERVSRGLAEDFHEALQQCCQPINDLLRDYYNANKDRFEVFPLRAGGDGWVIALQADEEDPCGELDSAIALMKKIRDSAPPKLPVLALHHGKAQLGIGGVNDLASLIAYLHAEKSRLSSDGDIILSRTFAQELEHERPLLHRQVTRISDKPIKLRTVGEAHIYRLGY